jgi:hypothetical protein
LSLWLSGAGRPVIHSFAGDPFAACAAHLGIAPNTAGEANRFHANEMRVRQTEAARRGQLQKIAFAKFVWDSGGDIKGTVGEAYLARRGVIPGANLRFSAFAPWGYDTGGQDGPRTGPGMVAAIRGPGGVLQGISVTHLRPDGQGRLKRLMFGRAKGGAVRLATASDVLAIGEGVETALSFTRLHGVPAWAALSTDGIASFTAPVGVKQLVICADNDRNGAGVDAARLLAARARSRCDVVISLPPRIGDWNDHLAATAP